MKCFKAQNKNHKALVNAGEATVDIVVQFNTFKEDKRLKQFTAVEKHPSIHVVK